MGAISRAFHFVIKKGYRSLLTDCEEIRKANTNVYSICYGAWPALAFK